MFFVFYFVFFVRFSRPRGRKTKKTRRNTETSSKINFIFGVTPNIFWHTYFAIPADSITVAASANAYWLKANSYRLLLQPATATDHWPWLLLLLLATRAALAPAPAVATAAVAASGMPACLPGCLPDCLPACIAV